MNVTNCRGVSCGAPIIFVRTRARNMMPVDADPIVAKGGESGFVVDDDEDPPTATWVSQAQAGQELYQSHHATCPDAARFRR